MKNIIKNTVKIIGITLISLTIAIGVQANSIKENCGVSGTPTRLELAIMSAMMK